MSVLKLECGCEIPIVDGVPQVDYYSLNLDCPKAWKVYQDGYTQSVFQLESYLGKNWSKKLKPKNIEDAAALISVIRPGCVSKDTQIMVNSNRLTTNGKKFHRSITIEQLYKNSKYYTKINSINEKTGELYLNNMLSVFPTGQKECFKLKLRRYRKNKANSYLGSNQYTLECTEEHKLLTPSGWKELKNIKYGERIAARKFTTAKRRKSNFVSNRHVPGIKDINIDGTKYFQEICFKNYYERCCTCGWNKANLDVNHISGNRHTNNNIDNLCFMCPNCHREFTVGLITKEQVAICQANSKLPYLEDVDWVVYEGCQSVGVKETYDISMTSPDNNFIAGNIVVHNSLQAEDENGVSLTRVFCERANSNWRPRTNSILDNLLEKTYGINIYQESSMIISDVLAGFDGTKQVKLIKGIGKKEAELLFSLRKEFVDGCIKVGKITEEEANAIFDNIAASARYAFNASHAIGYAVTGYWTAWAKSHLPKHYICAWLRNAKNEQKPLEEIRAIVSEARRLNIKVLPPSIKNLPTTNFFVRNDCVHFGLDSIKGCGAKGVAKLVKLDIDFDDCSWLDFLVMYSHHANKTQVTNMIRSGCFDYTEIDRAVCEYEYNQWLILKDYRDSIRKVYEEELNLTLIDLLSSYLDKNPKKTKVELVINSLKNPSSSLKDGRSNIIAHEKELMGINISCSAVDRATIPDARDKCGEVQNGRDNQIFILVGEISEAKEIKIKNGKYSGELMATFSLEDESGQCECVLFPKELSFYEGAIYDGNVVMVKGKKGRGRDNIAIEKVYEV